MPLRDIVVLDLTRARAGPTAVRQLADWGAQVVKVEMPPAKDASGMADNRDGFDFQNLHRNKRSLTLDLKSPAGREVFLRLAKEADVIIENFRPGVKHRLGIDYETIKAINPRIVYGSISGFGQEGPYKDRAGLDQIAQGLGGLMSVTGLPGQGPVRVGIPIADLSAGFNLALGVMVALYERERSGEGQWVHTSLLQAQIAMMDFQAARYLMDGEIPQQAGNNHPTGIPTGVFETSDGHLNIQAGAQRMWLRLCETLGAQALLEDARFENAASRLEHRDELNPLIDEYTRQFTTQQVIDMLAEAGVPCGPINNVGQTFADPQVQQLEMTPTVNHPRRGPLKVVGQAIKMSRTPSHAHSPTPDAGQHSEDVLAEVGYSAAEIARLKEDGVI
ncbi:MAG: CaiB/BaiF CoA transferase family protein [Gammaproteobacteria bacterium]